MRSSSANTPLNNAQRQFQIASGLKAAEFLEKAVADLEQNGNSLQAFVNHIFGQLELAGSFLVAAKDLSADEKCQALDAYGSTLLTLAKQQIEPEPMPFCLSTGSFLRLL